MSEDKKISASPKVRKFARELGTNVSQIKGTERKGRITEEDIKFFISKQLNKPKNFTKNDQSSNKIKSEFNHSDFGEIEVKEIPRVKKLSSVYLTNSWTTIPHVTNHDEADITEMENFRSSLKDMYSGERIKITPLYMSFRELLKFSISVISASSWFVTCGIVVQELLK
jgi:pyruvate dehydrogenase E2 component (dihydrolipoamide acetyltransferase)